MYIYSTIRFIIKLSSTFFFSSLFILICVHNRNQFVLPLNSITTVERMRAQKGALATNVNTKI